MWLPLQLAWSAAELADCPDAIAYWESLSSLLWGSVAPLLLGVCVSGIIFDVLRSIFSDV